MILSLISASRAARMHSVERMLAVLALCFLTTSLWAATTMPPPSPTQIARANKSTSVPAKHTSQGFSYTIDKLPAWVDSPQPPSGAATSSATWHYVMRDHQFLFGNSQIAAHTYITRKMDTAAGLADGARLEAYFEPSYQTLTFHEISIRRSGQVINKLLPSSVNLLRREQRLEQLSYDGFVTANINLDDARAGDLITYRYTISGSNPVLQGRASFFEPVKLPIAAADFVRIRMRHTPARNVIVTGGVGLDRRELGNINGMNETVLQGSAIAQWTLRADAPPREAFDNYVVASEFANYKQLAAWGRDLFSGASGSQTLQTQLAEQAREIAAKSGTDETARIENALTFVQQQIRYFSASFGESSHRPAAPDKVLSQRYGDCKDKSLLLVALLKKMNINAYPILVSQGYRGDVKYFPISHGAFDHAIVGVESGGKTYWLDPTRTLQVGTLEERQAWSFKHGLVLKEGAADLIAAPARPKGEVDSVVRDTYNFLKLGEPAELSSEIIYKGEIAERVKLIMDTAQRTQVEQSIFEYFARRFTDAKESVPLKVEPNVKDASVSLKKSWAIAEPFTLFENRLLGLEFGPWSIFPELRRAPDTMRTGALYLGLIKSLRHDIVLNFSEDVVREKSEKTQTFEDKHFRLSWQIKQSPRSLELQYQFETFAEQVEAADTNAFQEKLREAAAEAISTFAISVVPLERVETLQKEIIALGQKIDRGQIKRVTRAQVRSEIDILINEYRLNSGRLTPKLRASVLRDRAVAYDNTNRPDEALADLNAALVLSPKDAAIFGTKAETQFGRGEFKYALATLAAQEKLASSQDAEFLFQRARIYYYNDELQEAARDFLTSHKASTGARKAFALAWLQVTAWRQNTNRDEEFKKLSDDVKLTTWPQPILRFYRGEINEDALLKAAKSTEDSIQRSQLCEAYFYIGQRYLKGGDTQNAMRAFEKSRETEVYEYVEYRAAGFEIARLRKQLRP